MGNELTLPLDKFYEHEKKRPNETFFRQPLDGVWHEMDWKTVGQEVRKMAQALRDKNFPPKSKIAILSKNCSHWVMADLAIWMAGHISIPLYPTLTATTIREILDHSESQFLFAGKLDDWEKQKTDLPSDLPMVHFPHWKNSDCTSWDDFVEGKEPLQETVKRNPKDICTIIYTSGTTGTAKGVVHSFETFSTPINTAYKMLGLSSNEKFFSYLPLAHVAERLIVEVAAIYCGGTISFAESLDTFPKNLVDTQPSIFLAVPRIWTKFQLGILGKMPQKKLDFLTSIPILGGIIRKKILTKLGLSNARIALSGAAPISADLLNWWKKVGVEVQEAYGMTENFCYGTFSHRGRVKFGTVGENWPDSQSKIGENSEILLKSSANMIGYYKDEVQTKEAIDSEGWLHTGDQGEIDSDGYLKITGRVKELFKTSKGKYVAPTPIEKLFSMCSLVEQVCVVGSGLPQPIALVVLSDAGKEAPKDKVEKEIEELLGSVNGNVENYERLTSIIVLNDDWSTESGILTPTLKIKRNVVEKKYGPNLEGWSGQKSPIVFA
jgi:long-chain acyl-CoA synthetase